MPTGPSTSLRDSSSAHNTLGTVLDALGRTDEARTDVPRGRTRSIPAAGWALSNLCYLEFEAGHFDEARRQCEAALRRIAGARRPRTTISRSRTPRSGDLVAAREAFLVGGDSAAACYNIGIVLSRGGALRRSGHGISAGHRRPSGLHSGKNPCARGPHAGPRHSIPSDHDAHYCTTPGTSTGVDMPLAPTHTSGSRPDSRPADSARPEDAAFRRRADRRRTRASTRDQLLGHRTGNGLPENAAAGRDRRRHDDGPRLLPLPDHRRGPSARRPVPGVEPLRRRGAGTLRPVQALHADPS